MVTGMYSPPPKRPWYEQRRLLASILLVVLGAAAAAGGFVGAYSLRSDSDEAPSPVEESSAPAAPPTAGAPQNPEPDFNQPLVVNVISEPATGGDPSSSYCLSWTGSESDAGRDAVLLMNAPGYQCAAALVTSTDGQSHGPYGVLYETPTECAAEGTYPAVLQSEGWGVTFYVCLHDHTGA